MEQDMRKAFRTNQEKMRSQSLFRKKDVSTNPVNPWTRLCWMCAHKGPVVLAKCICPTAEETKSR